MRFLSIFYYFAKSWGRCFATTFWMNAKVLDQSFKMPCLPRSNKKKNFYHTDERGKLTINVRNLQARKFFRTGPRMQQFTGKSVPSRKRHFLPKKRNNESEKLKMLSSNEPRFWGFELPWELNIEPKLLSQCSKTCRSSAEPFSFKSGLIVAFKKYLLWSFHR